MVLTERQISYDGGRVCVRTPVLPCQKYHVMFVDSLSIISGRPLKLWNNIDTFFLFFFLHGGLIT